MQPVELRPETQACFAYVCVEAFCRTWNAGCDVCTHGQRVRCYRAFQTNTVPLPSFALSPGLRAYIWVDSTQCLIAASETIAHSHFASTRCVFTLISHEMTQMRAINLSKRRYYIQHSCYVLCTASCYGVRHNTMPDVASKPASLAEHIHGELCSHHMQHSR